MTVYPEAGGSKLDYAFDGLELDEARFPHDEAREFIRAIDNAVSTEAAHYLRDVGPELSWVYLEYTDDIGHIYGEGDELTAAVAIMDANVGKIWKAVQDRQKTHGENWLVVVTTDHGRDEETGKSHGGQSLRERTTWIATNSQRLNSNFENLPGIVDILPSILDHLAIAPPPRIARAARRSFIYRSTRQRASPMRKLIISLFLMAHSLVISALVSAQVTMSAQETPYLFILGVAQDAGYPQVGCYQPHCMPGWENPSQRRTATSLALLDPLQNLSYLFEATPHLPEQLYALQKEAPTTRTGLDGVFLTHAHIGHYAGLMHFGREAMNAQGLPVYAMPLMSAYLRNNGPWSQLVALNNVALMPLGDNRPVALTTALSVTPMLVPHRDEFSETIGYRIEGPNKSALFIPRH